MDTKSIHIMLLELSHKMEQFSKSKYYRESNGAVEDIFNDASNISIALKNCRNGSTDEVYMEIILCAAQRVAIAVGDFSGAVYWSGMQKEDINGAEFLNGVLQASGVAQLANLKFAIALLKAFDMASNLEVRDVVNELPPSNNIH